MKTFKTEYERGAIVYVNDYGTTFEAKIIGEIEQAGIYSLKILATSTNQVKKIMRAPHKIYETEEAAIGAMYEV